MSKTSAISRQTAAREELRVLFQIFDTENIGSIDARELKAAFRALGVPASVEEIKQLMAGFGRSSSDAITFDEFCHLAEGRLPQRDSKEAILQTFELLGGSEHSCVDIRHLKQAGSAVSPSAIFLQACDELGENISDAELQLMISEADCNGDGKIDFREFARVMRRKFDPLGSDSD